LGYLSAKVFVLGKLGDHTEGVDLGNEEHDMAYTTGNESERVRESVLCVCVCILQSRP